MVAAEGVSGEEGQVEACLERISEGMLSEDRREGMDQLKGYLQSHAVPATLEAFAAMGVPVMCSVLRDDIEDLELIQARFLHCLSNRWYDLHLHCWWVST